MAAHWTMRMEQAKQAKHRRTALVLVVAIVVLSASLISTVAFWQFAKKPQRPLPEGFYLGVTSGGNVSEIKILVDKIKDTANTVVFTNLEVTMNLTSLREVSDYAYAAGLNFLPFMVYPSPHSNFTYNPVTWTTEAKSQYGDKFLGYYLWDEPGGNQLDHGSFRQFDETTMPRDYREAANTYVYYLFLQIRDFIKTDRLFTADYTLHWYDYEAGYDVVLCDFIWNNSRPVNIAQCRGAAEMHNKTWGAMITWQYNGTPFVESALEMYNDMITAYNAGAKYITIFNYPQTGLNGVLSEAHFDAIKQFRQYAGENPQNQTSNTQHVAYVLPENYGFGLRSQNDTIWGVWNADAYAKPVWEKMNSLIQTYGDDFDIITDSPWTRLFGRQHYSNLVWWNSTG